MKQLKCGNCPFFSGVHCQGHGDYWGECNLINVLKIIFADKFKCSVYDIVLRNGLYDFGMCVDESTCVLFERKGEVINEIESRKYENR